MCVRQVAVLTGSGGHGILAADRLYRADIELVGIPEAD